MAEGKLSFYAQPTPSWDTFQTVTLGVGISQAGGRGAVVLHADVSTDEARAYARQIIAAVDIVDRERREAEVHRA